MATILDVIPTSEPSHDAAREIAHVVECAVLRSLDMFRHLSPADLECVASVARFQRIAVRKPIAVSNSESCVYILTEGTAKVTRSDANGGEMIMYLLKSGELFGSQISSVREDTQVVALHPSVVASIQMRDLQGIVAPCVLAEEIDRIRELRVSQMEDRLADVSIGRVTERAARTVLRLCREFPARLPCGTKVDVRFTQKDIASMIGATREVTSLTLNAFRREGWLDVHDRYMCVHDAEGLRAMAT